MFRGERTAVKDAPDFNAFARTLGVRLGPRAQELLSVYLEELLRWNERVNLVAAARVQEIVARHFLDSISCLRALAPDGPLDVVDVGAGAGFPGLVVRIAREAPTRLLLVESSHKKCAFLEEIVGRLELGDVDIVRARVESPLVTERHDASFDAAMCRGVGDVKRAARYCLPLLRQNGRMLLQRGARSLEGVLEAEDALRKIGGRIKAVYALRIPGLAGNRVIIVVGKEASRT